MDNRKVAQQVIEHLGGKENITNALHCVTRLRFNVKEDAKVNGAAIEAIDGVMGMQIKNGQYQIIIGPIPAAFAKSMLITLQRSKKIWWIFA